MPHSGQYPLPLRVKKVSRWASTTTSTRHRLPRLRLADRPRRPRSQLLRGDTSHPIPTGEVHRDAPPIQLLDRYVPRLRQSSCQLGPTDDSPVGGGSSSASGTMIHIATYITRPAPPAKANAMNRTRISVGSTLKYSARPPATPATMRLVWLRYSFRGSTGFGCYGCSSSMAPTLLGACRYLLAPQDRGFHYLTNPDTCSTIQPSERARYRHATTCADSREAVPELRRRRAATAERDVTGCPGGEYQEKRRM
jgi:hypothetical protein